MGNIVSSDENCLLTSLLETGSLSYLTYSILSCCFSYFHFRLVFDRMEKRSRERGKGMLIYPSGRVIFA